MKKKIKKRELTHRELNAFPFLAMPLEERLQKAGAVNLENNHTITKNGHYWTIKPIGES